MEESRNNTSKMIIALIIVAAIVALTVFLVKGKNNNADENKNDNTQQATPTPTATTIPTTTIDTEPTINNTPTVSVTTSPTSSTSITPTPSTSSTPAPTLAQNKVRVYYSVDPESFDDFTYAFFYELTTNSTNRGEFALSKLIAGPTAEQKENQKVFTPIKLTGDSNCAGKDFTFTLDQENNKATVQFCKNVTTSGVGDDARVKVTVTNTLKDTLSVQDVIILNKDGNCFGDQSGLNQCKK